MVHYRAMNFTFQSRSAINGLVSFIILLILAQALAQSTSTNITTSNEIFIGVTNDFMIQTDLLYNPNVSVYLVFPLKFFSPQTSFNCYELEGDKVIAQLISDSAVLPQGLIEKQSLKFQVVPGVLDYTQGEDYDLKLSLRCTLPILDPFSSSLMGIFGEPDFYFRPPFVDGNFEYHFGGSFPDDRIKVYIFENIDDFTIDDFTYNPLKISFPSADVKLVKSTYNDILGRYLHQYTIEASHIGRYALALPLHTLFTDDLFIKGKIEAPIPLTYLTPSQHPQYPERNTLNRSIGGTATVDYFSSAFTADFQGRMLSIDTTTGRERFEGSTFLFHPIPDREMLKCGDSIVLVDVEVPNVTLTMLISTKHELQKCNSFVSIGRTFVFTDRRIGVIDGLLLDDDETSPRQITNSDHYTPLQGENDPNTDDVFLEITSNPLYRHVTLFSYLNMGKLVDGLKIRDKTNPDVKEDDEYLLTCNFRFLDFEPSRMIQESDGVTRTPAVLTQGATSFPFTRFCTTPTRSADNLTGQFQCNISQSELLVNIQFMISESQPMVIPIGTENNILETLCRVDTIPHGTDPTDYTQHPISMEPDVFASNINHKIYIQDSTQHMRMGYAKSSSSDFIKRYQEYMNPHHYGKYVGIDASSPLTSDSYGQILNHHYGYYPNMMNEWSSTAFSIIQLIDITDVTTSQSPDLWTEGTLESTKVEILSSFSPLPPLIHDKTSSTRLIFQFRFDYLYPLDCNPKENRCNDQTNLTHGRMSCTAAEQVPIDVTPLPLDFSLYGVDEFITKVDTEGDELLNMVPILPKMTHIGVLEADFTGYTRFALNFQCEMQGGSRIFSRYIPMNYDGTTDFAMYRFRSIDPIDGVFTHAYVYGDQMQVINQSSVLASSSNGNDFSSQSTNTPLQLTAEAGKSYPPVLAPTMTIVFPQFYQLTSQSENALKQCLNQALYKKLVENGDGNHNSNVEQQYLETTQIALVSLSYPFSPSHLPLSDQINSSSMQYITRDPSDIELNGRMRSDYGVYYHQYRAYTLMSFTLWNQDGVEPFNVHPVDLNAIYGDKMKYIHLDKAFLDTFNACVMDIGIILPPQGDDTQQQQQQQQQEQEQISSKVYGDISNPTLYTATSMQSSKETASSGHNQHKSLDVSERIEYYHNDFDSISSQIDFATPIPINIISKQKYLHLFEEMQYPSSTTRLPITFELVSGSISIPADCLSKREAGTCSHRCNIQCPSSTSFTPTAPTCDHHLDCSLLSDWAPYADPNAQNNRIVRRHSSCVKQDIDNTPLPRSYCQYDYHFAPFFQHAADLSYVDFEYRYFSLDLGKLNIYSHVMDDPSAFPPKMVNVLDIPNDVNQLPFATCTTKVYIACYHKSIGQYVSSSLCKSVQLPDSSSHTGVRLVTHPLGENSLDGELIIIKDKYKMLADDEFFMIISASSTAQYYVPDCSQAIADLMIDIDQSSPGLIISIDGLAYVIGILQPGKVVALTWDQVTAPPNTQVDFIVRGFSMYTHNGVPSTIKKDYVIGRATIGDKQVKLTIPTLNLLEPNQAIAEVIAVVTEYSDQSETHIYERTEYNITPLTYWMYVSICQRYDPFIPQGVEDLCLNGGTCGHSIGQCVCTPGFVGPLCQYPICLVPENALLPSTEPSQRATSGINCNPDGTTKCIVNGVEYDITESIQEYTILDASQSSTSNVGFIPQSEPKCTCASGWSGVLCDVYDQCQASGGSDQTGTRCLNGFIEYDHDSNQCKTESCTCRGKFGGLRCEQCMLNCKNGGKPSSRCTECACGRGFDGEQCQCRVQYASLTFGKFPTFIEDVVKNITQDVIDGFNPKTDLKDEAKYKIYYKALEDLTAFERLSTHISITISNEMKITPASRVVVQETKIESTAGGSPSLRLYIGFRDTCTNNPQDILDVENAWKLFLQRFKFNPDLFGDDELGPVSPDDNVDTVVIVDEESSNGSMSNYTINSMFFTLALVNMVMMMVMVVL